MASSHPLLLIGTLCLQLSRNIVSLGQQLDKNDKKYSCEFTEILDAPCSKWLSFTFCLLEFASQTPYWCVAFLSELHFTSIATFLCLPLPSHLPHPVKFLLQIFYSFLFLPRHVKLASLMLAISLFHLLSANGLLFLAFCSLCLQLPTLRLCRVVV